MAHGDFLGVELAKTGFKPLDMRLIKPFPGLYGKVARLHCVKVGDKFKSRPGTETQLVLLAMGFASRARWLSNAARVDLDQRGNVRANMADYQTSRPNVFSAGDMRRGQSLVVWAIREGRLCAHNSPKDDACFHRLRRRSMKSYASAVSES